MKPDETSAVGKSKQSSEEIRMEEKTRETRKGVRERERERESDRDERETKLRGRSRRAESGFNLITSWGDGTRRDRPELELWKV